MTKSPDRGRMPTTKAELDTCTIGGARPHGGRVRLVGYDPSWPELFRREAERIARLLGPSALSIEHVGSTSVPELAAKPIIDMVLEVADSRDEASYVAPLVAEGYELRICEPEWWEHRMLKGPDTDINLHVFTSGCPEVARMVRCRERLRANPVDRCLYEAKKRALAAQHWEYVQHYADAKSAVIGDIIARAGNAR